MQKLWRRFWRTRVALAEWLLQGTGRVVVVDEDLQEVMVEVTGLAAYVPRSGGLCDPRRIRAKRKIERSLSRMTLRLHRAQLVWSAAPAPGYLEHDE